MRTMVKFARSLTTGGLAAAGLILGSTAFAQTKPTPLPISASRPSPVRTDPKASPRDTVKRVQATTSDTITSPPSPPTILDPNVRPIDLPTALRLGGVQNPQLLI